MDFFDLGTVGAIVNSEASTRAVLVRYSRHSAITKGKCCNRGKQHLVVCIETKIEMKRTLLDFVHISLLASTADRRHLMMELHVPRAVPSTVAGVETHIIVVIAN